MRKRFVDLEKRLTEQVSRLRLQVEQMEISLGLREEGELRGAWELCNEWELSADRLKKLIDREREGEPDDISDKT